MSTRKALTLVEVLAALAVLGVILVGVVLAKSRHVRQLSRIRSQQDIVEIADEILAEWWSSSDGPPIDKSGISETEPAILWQTALVPNDEIENLDARVLHVEFRLADNGKTNSGTGDSQSVVVELVLPAAKSEEVEAAND